MMMTIKKINNRKMKKMVINQRRKKRIIRIQRSKKTKIPTLIMLTIIKTLISFQMKISLVLKSKR